MNQSLFGKNVGMGGGPVGYADSFSRPRDSMPGNSPVGLPPGEGGRPGGDLRPTPPWRPPPRDGSQIGRTPPGVITRRPIYGDRPPYSDGTPPSRQPPYYDGTPPSAPPGMPPVGISPIEGRSRQGGDLNTQSMMMRDPNGFLQYILSMLSSGNGMM